MISVIIPIYILDDELKELTLKCLKSINRRNNWCEVIIIDNGGMKMKIDADIYIRNKRNKGNAVAWNQGAKLATGDWLLFVDNDTVFPENWAEMKCEDDVIAFPQTKCKEDNEFRQRLSGFFWIISRKTFEKLGFISEEYGLAYFEDTDYFMRAQRAGVKLKCFPGVKVEHYGMATADKMELGKVHTKNEQLYNSKFEGEYPHL